LYLNVAKQRARNNAILLSRCIGCGTAALYCRETSRVQQRRFAVAKQRACNNAILLLLDCRIVAKASKYAFGVNR
jgi:hypothetical protein